MKNIFVLFMMILGLSGAASAGPIDWCLNQVGYTPTEKYTESVQALHEANALVAGKNQMIQSLQDTIRYLQSLSSSTVTLSLVFGMALAIIAGYKAGGVGLYQKMREKLKKKAQEKFAAVTQAD